MHMTRVAAREDLTGIAFWTERVRSGRLISISPRVGLDMETTWTACLLCAANSPRTIVARLANDLDFEESLSVEDESWRFPLCKYCVIEGGSCYLCNRAVDKNGAIVLGPSVQLDEGSCLPQPAHALPKAHLLSDSFLIYQVSFLTPSALKTERNASERVCANPGLHYYLPGIVFFTIL